MRFKNKVVVVTGAARDIGKAIAQKLAAEGARVVIHYFRSDEEAEQTLEEIRTNGGEASIFKANLTRGPEVEKLKAFCEKTYGDRVDVLVNNAGGIVARRKQAEQDESFYNAVMDLNFRSVFLMTHAFVPIMPAGGAIVNISSLAARDGGGAGASLYAASKGAMTTYTRGMAKELGPADIRVNAVCPGLIDTTFHDLFTSNEMRENIAAATPLGREGTSEEVAHLVAFLASDEAAFITGCNYDINGGLGLS